MCTKTLKSLEKFYPSLSEFFFFFFFFSFSFFKNALKLQKGSVFTEAVATLLK